MNITIADRPSSVRIGTRSLMQRMLNPFTGLCRTIGFMSRSERDPRFITAGGDLTGVHFLRAAPEPPLGYYHIGGSGIFLDEALIRCLGETVERYGQFVSDVSGRQRVEVATYDEMVRRRERIVDAAKLRFFSGADYTRPGLPYKPFRPDMPMGWVAARSLLNSDTCWVPAQLVLVGYTGRPGEQRLLSSVTTGTAAHTDRGAALRNALLELVQIDSSMGHWYSAAVAPQIDLDQRCRAITALIERHATDHPVRPRFHWLRNPDLAGFSVACVIRRPADIPSIGIGLGVGLRLERAMYGALLEAVGVLQMGKKALIDRADDGRRAAGEPIDPNAIFDLDSNVIYYADAHNAPLLDAKFDPSSSIAASDLPPDIVLDPRGEARHVVESFRRSSKELYWLDLTTPDAHDLGFVICRVWSPDTLSLSLPSAPPVEHARFQAYGGVAHTRPHPYP